MDSRWIPVILGVGWGLLTVAVWGACGQLWWIWPASVGLSCLAVGGAYGWAHVVQVRQDREKVIPGEVRT